MRQHRRSAAGLIATGLAIMIGCALTGCGAPSYVYASDSADQAYFKVPANWHEVNPQFLADTQDSLLTKSLAGAAGGPFIWSRAYDAASSPSSLSLLEASNSPVVYATVQNLRDSLRSELSFDVMRDLLFPVTPTARQEASEAGDTLTGFVLLDNSTITNKYGMRGINELYEYTIGGQPDAFDQTVLTNAATTKLYLLLVQCYQACFVAHEAQIEAVVNSFTVGGS